MLKKWTTEKAIIREADRLVSSKENLDALSWSRVEEIADRLRSGSANSSECAELARELIAIAQANKSALGKLGLSDAECPSFRTQTTAGGFAGCNDDAAAKKAASEEDDNAMQEVEELRVEAPSADSAPDGFDARCKAGISASIYPDDSSNLPEWAVRNNESDSVAAFFAGEGESAHDIRPVVIPRGEERAVFQDTQSNAEEADAAKKDEMPLPDNAQSGQHGALPLDSEDSEPGGKIDEPAGAPSDSLQALSGQPCQSEKKKSKAKKGKAKKSKKGKKEKKSDKNRGHASSGIPLEEDACKDQEETCYQKGEAMAEQEKPQADVSAVCDSHTCPDGGGSADSDGRKGGGIPGSQADFARFRSIYSSRDGAFALFEDHEGHITAVDTSKLA